MRVILSQTTRGEEASERASVRRREANSQKGSFRSSLPPHFHAGELPRRFSAVRRQLSSCRSEKEGTRKETKASKRSSSIPPPSLDARRRKKGSAFLFPSVRALLPLFSLYLFSRPLSLSLSTSLTFSSPNLLPPKTTATTIATHPRSSPSWPSPSSRPSSSATRPGGRSGSPPTRSAAPPRKTSFARSTSCHTFWPSRGPCSTGCCRSRRTARWSCRWRRRSASTTRSTTRTW